MTNKTYLQAAALGVATGMRSMSALLALSRSTSRKKSWKRTIFSVLASPAASALLPVAAVGELIGDKLPMVPDRTDPLPLAGRLLFGALAGAALFTSEKEPAAVGAAMGVLGTLAGTFAAYRVRKAAGQKLPLPGWLLGVIEDALTYSLALRILRD